MSINTSLGVFSVHEFLKYLNVMKFSIGTISKGKSIAGKTKFMFNRLKFHCAYSMVAIILSYGFEG